MSLAGATGLIGTAVGLGVLVGVTAIAFDAVGRALPDNRSRGRSKRRSQQRENIFDLGLTQSTPRKTRKKKFSQDFGSDFNIFAI